MGRNKNIKGKMDISVIIPTRNHWECLLKLLESIQAQKVPSTLSYEVIVVDNNSTDKTREIVEKFTKKEADIFKYAFETNKGVTYARNTGIQLSRGEILVFTDDDCVADEHWLKEIKACFKKENPGAVVGKIEIGTELPKGMSYPKRFIEQRFAHTNYGNKNIESADINLVGCNMIIKRDVIDQCGMFDHNPAFHVSEDTEFSIRIAKYGIKKMYCPSIKVKHLFTVDRIDEVRLLKQSFYFGRANIFYEPQGLSPLRHFLYSIKQILINTGRLLKAVLKNDYEDTFFIKSKICGSWGRCYQIMVNSFTPYGRAYVKERNAL